MAIFYERASDKAFKVDFAARAGKASDLINLIESVDIKRDEDSRAVLTDYMHRNPDSILLDYQQQLLGESRKSKDNHKKDCFGRHNDEVVADMRRLDSVEDYKKPLF